MPQHECWEHKTICPICGYETIETEVCDIGTNGGWTWLSKICEHHTEDEINQHNKAIEELAEYYKDNYIKLHCYICKDRTTYNKISKNKTLSLFALCNTGVPVYQTFCQRHFRWSINRYLRKNPNDEASFNLLPQDIKEFFTGA